MPSAYGIGSRSQPKRRSWTSAASPERPKERDGGRQGGAQSLSVGNRARTACSALLGALVADSTLKRSSPLRRTPFGRKPKTAEKKADALFSRRIRARDRCCRRCGAAGDLDTAHVIRRRFHAVRWVEINAVALCRRCHVLMGMLGEGAWRQWCLEEEIPWDGLHWRAVHDPAERPEDALARLKAST